LIPAYKLIHQFIQVVAKSAWIHSVERSWDEKWSHVCARSSLAFQ